MPAIVAEYIDVSVKTHFWSVAKKLLSDVSLVVEAGEIFGFLGANGAGKTTTIKVLTGLLTPTRGRALIAGVDVRRPNARRRFGFLPERTYLPEHLTAREFVHMHALLAGLTRREAAKAAIDCLAEVGLQDAMDTRLGVFSKGMLQRAALAQALCGDPEVVILDEPMSGLDPIGRRDVRDIMLRLRARGKTVFFSTHILPDVELICDRVGILVGGVLKRIGTLRDLGAADGGAMEVVAGPLSDNAQAALAPFAGAIKRQAHSTIIECINLAAANQAIDVLRAAHVQVHAVGRGRGNLEAVFLALERQT